MSKCIIGFGKCSYFYFYILGSFLFKNLKTFFSKPNDILIMNGHRLVKSIYKYFGYIIFGFLFKFILNRNLKSQKQNEDNEKKSNDLIFYNALDLGYSNKSFFLFIIICFLYIIYQESVEAFMFFRLKTLLFWTAHLAFMFLFMYCYFPENIYKHQQFSIILVIIVDSILIVFATFLKNRDDKNIYQSKGIPLCISIIVSYILFAFLNAFSCVQLKKYMDKKYLSPYNIIILIGVIGFILSLLTSLFFSVFGNSCPGKYEKNIFCYCDARTYFDEVKSSFKDNKKLFLIKAFIINPINLIIEFIYITLDIFIIKYLDPIYSVLAETINLLIFIFIAYFDKYDDKLRFGIYISSEIFKIIGFCIYLEIIELRFCGLDKNTRKNIISRGDIDSDQARNNKSNSNFSVEENYNIIEENLFPYD